MVDDARGRVYASSAESNTISVLDFDGRLIKVIEDEPGAFGMVLAGDVLYVALSTGGAVDAISTQTLTRTRRLAADQIDRPTFLVLAGGRLWTRSAAEGFLTDLVGIDPATGEVSRYSGLISSELYFTGSDALPNSIFFHTGMGVTPGRLYRFDVSGGTPAFVAGWETDVANISDLTVSPDGTRLFISPGWPYEIREHRTSDLAPTGKIYETVPYPNATAVTAARKGLLAAGSNSVYWPDVVVFRIGNPAENLITHEFGENGGQLFPRGLAMTGDGSKVFAVTGTGDYYWNKGPARFHVLPTETAVAATGYNGFGQLGGANTVDAVSPRSVAPLDSARDVSAGLLHTVAARSDGTAWAWGNGTWGQIGNGGNLDQLTPTKVAGIEGVVDVSAGLLHNLAVTEDGAVWSWGYNGFGQLGNGNLVDQAAPHKVGGVYRIVAVSAGAFHSLALDSDGVVWAWGWNGFGQLGDGTLKDRTSPVRVKNLVGASSIAAGGFHSLVAEENGRALGWGWNGLGQLGNGTTTDSSTPRQVAGPTNVRTVSAGYAHSHAVGTDGSLRSWGWNAMGQLGDGTRIDRVVPVNAKLPQPVSSISAGLLHSLAVSQDRSWAFGWNGFGQLGDGTRTDRLVPAPMDSAPRAFQAAAGGYHSAVVIDPGTGAG